MNWLNISNIGGHITINEGRTMTAEELAEVDALPLIRLREHPVKAGTLFGTIVDADGKRWDFNGYAAGRVLACEADRIVYNTSSYGSARLGTTVWLPRRFEVVGESVGGDQK